MRSVLYFNKIISLDLYKQKRVILRQSDIDCEDVTEKTVSF